MRAAIRLARGDARGATSDTEAALAVARRAKDDQVLAHALGGRAIMAVADNRPDEARELASELESLGAPLIFPLTFGWPTLADVGWLMHDLERVPHLLRMLDGLPVATRWGEAARAIANGDFVAAAETLAQMGDAAGEANARLRAADLLRRAGRQPEAGAQLARALEFYRAAGATRVVREGEALIAASAAQA